MDLALSKTTPKVTEWGVRRVRNTTFEDPDVKMVESTMKTSLFHYQDPEELGRRLTKKFQGKSMCFHVVKDHGPGKDRVYPQFNGEWKETEKWRESSYRSFIRAENIRSVRMFRMSDIVHEEIEKLREFILRKQNNDRYKNAQLLNYWYSKPGLHMTAKDFYPHLSEADKGLFWGHRFRDFDGDYHESLEKVARFMSVHEPQYEKYLGMRESEAFPLLLELVQESGATDRNELAGNVLGFRGTSAVRAGLFKGRERQQILAFHIMLRPSLSKFFQECEEELRMLFEANIVRRVHES